MESAHSLRRQVMVAVTLVVAATLVGCTRHEETAEPGSVSWSAGTPAAPAPTQSVPRPSTAATTDPSTAVKKPPSAEDWPDRAVPADQAPELGESKVITPGYRADDFLTGLAARWDIPLGEPRLIDAPRGRKVWHFSGGVPHDGERRMAIAGVPTQQGDIMVFSCMVKADQRQAEAFLQDCIDTGIPRWDSEDASAWLKTAKRQVDALYVKENRQVVSSLFVSAGAHALLRRSGPTPESVGTYELSVGGGGITETP
ncbi:hypothetical protein [Streptomyces sp. NPDC058955]|uniref:hypothetical protein n=1 Tax=unclassified Streptomyces TaxID=2593676 RepID=UPI00364D1039